MSPIMSAVLVICFFIGCNNRQIESNNYLAFDNVEYIDEFPIRYTLSDAVVPDIDAIGVFDLQICDTLMIFSSTNGKKGFLSFVSLNDYKTIGNYIKQGNGPTEMLMAPYINRAAIENQKDDLYLIFRDFIKGTMLKMNVSGTLRNGTADVSKIGDSISSHIFSLLYVNDTLSINTELNKDATRQERYFVVNGKKIVPRPCEILNRANIERGEDVNILSSIVKCNAEKKVVVDMPVLLNNINIYTLDGSFAKTLCVGKRLDNIDAVQSKSRLSRLNTYTDLRLYDDFFGAMYLGANDYEYEMDKKKCPSIQFFDYDGRPLALIKLSNPATTFDIDFKSGCIYTLDSRFEKFYLYKANDIINKLRRK